MELGGGDESDRDRVGTLDPDDAEDSTGKPASDEKDKAGAEEEKEDTPQVSVGCYDRFRCHFLPSRMRYKVNTEICINVPQIRKPLLCPGPCASNATRETPRVH